MRFRPSILSTVTAVVVSLTCARLSVWQWNRYQGKEAELAELRARHDRDPLTDLSAVGDDPDFRRVRLSGRYRPRGHVVAGGIPYGRNGYAVVGVLDLEGGDSVLVQRGWIPSEGWLVHRDPEAVPTVVEGVLAAVGDRATRVDPWTDPRTGEALWPLEMQTFLGVFQRGVDTPWPSMVDAIEGVRKDVVVLQGPELPDPEARKPYVLPAPGYVLERKTFHHLEYSAQWLGFATLAWVVWGVVAWRRAARMSGG